MGVQEAVSDSYVDCAQATTKTWQALRVSFLTETDRQVASSCERGSVFEVSGASFAKSTS